jgi:hypothetical protein
MAKILPILETNYCLVVRFLTAVVLCAGLNVPNTFSAEDSEEDTSSCSIIGTGLVGQAEATIKKSIQARSYKSTKAIKAPLSTIILEVSDHLDLEELRLRSIQQATEDVFMPLARLNNLKSLELVCVSGITDKLIMHFACNLTDLEKLTLIDTEIDVTGLMELSQLEKLKMLTLHNENDRSLPERHCAKRLIKKGLPALQSFTYGGFALDIFSIRQGA